MSKHKHTNGAVTIAAKQAGQIAIPGLAGRRVSALMAEGDRIAASLSNGHTRALQAVCAKGQPFHAVIKHGNTVMQFEGDAFAVTTHD